MKIKKEILSILITIVVIGILILAGPAKALNIVISNIPDTNKGDLLEFDITVNLNDPDQFIPILYTKITINHEDPGNIDKIECKVQNSEVSCLRYKGSLNNPKNYTDIEVNVTSTSSFGYGYGYGYDQRINNSVNFGYGYGFNEGKITYHVTWQTPVNLQPGKYSVKAEVVTNNYIFESDEKEFKIITPANPNPSISLSGDNTGSSGGPGTFIYPTRNETPPTPTTPSTPFIEPPTTSTAEGILPAFISAPGSDILPLITGAVLGAGASESSILNFLVFLFLFLIIVGAVYQVSYVIWRRNKFR